MNCMKTIGLLLLVFLFSCGKKEEQTAQVDEPLQDVKLKKVPGFLQLQPAYQDTLDKWTDYKLLELEMQKFRKQKPMQLGLTVEELLRLEKELSQKPFPEKLNIPAVKARFIVLRTLLLETKNLIAENADAQTLNANQIKIVSAFNSLRKQLSEALRAKVYEDVLKKADSLNTNNEFEDFEELENMIDNQ